VRAHFRRKQSVIASPAFLGRAFMPFDEVVAATGCSSHEAAVALTESASRFRPSEGAKIFIMIHGDLIGFGQRG